MSGGAGNDTLDAIGANNTVVGGSGNEAIIVNDPSTTVQVSAGIGHDTVFSSVNYDVPNNVSVLTLTGTVGLHSSANMGNDLITGTTAGDYLIDGGGADTFAGGGGNDIILVNSTADVVSEPVGSVGSEIISTVSYTLPANVSSLILNG